MYIRILLTRSPTLLSRLIYLITRAPFTHVSMSFEDDLAPLYSSARKNGVTMFPAGPCREYLRRGYYSRHPEIRCALYRLEVSEETYQKAKSIAEERLSRADEYHFNILGLVANYFGIAWTRKKHFFCSQFVGNILRDSGAMVLPKDTALLKPVDYTAMPELECVYRGTIGSLLEQVDPVPEV